MTKILNRPKETSLMSNYSRSDLAFVRGKGVRLFDKTGKISNPTFGVGFRFSNYGFDFGYTSGAVGHPLTNTMRFSMNMQF